MKNDFARALLSYARTDTSMVFLTGDLGFNCFEELWEILDDRFINAGVAEQNMVGVAAGMAYTGLRPWIYSIAPFLILKTIEQLRNDVFIRGLDVKLVGNGGGFGYGIHGTTHHLLEDIALFRALPNAKVYIPAFTEDIPEVVARMHGETTPSYIRMGLATHKRPINLYKPVRRIVKGTQATMVVLGPVIHQALPLVEQFAGVVDIWVISELPCRLPTSFWKSVQQTKKIVVAEEAAAAGGLGEFCSQQLIKMGIMMDDFIHLSASYADKKYGSQQYFLKENGMDTKSLERTIFKLIG